MRPFFFFNDTATTEIYTLSLHDALPISDFRNTSVSGPGQNDAASLSAISGQSLTQRRAIAMSDWPEMADKRSEEHTSELQSLTNLVCRLLLEKKNYTFCTADLELTLSVR